jgi:hypothetical protein
VSAALLFVEEFAAPDVEIILPATHHNPNFIVLAENLTNLFESRCFCGNKACKEGYKGREDCHGRHPGMPAFQPLSREIQWSITFLLRKSQDV